MGKDLFWITSRLDQEKFGSDPSNCTGFFLYKSINWIFFQANLFAVFFTCAILNFVKQFTTSFDFSSPEKVTCMIEASIDSVVSYAVTRKKVSVNFWRWCTVTLDQMQCNLKMYLLIRWKFQKALF